MKRRILLTALLLLLTGCQQSPEQARKELAELGVAFSPSVFHESVENGDVVVVELFLTAGMKPDITDEDGRTALMRAVLKNNLSVARVLLDSGAKVEPRGLVDWPAEQGHTEMVRLLAGAGDEISRSVLSEAKRRGDTEIVELFESTELVEADYESFAISAVQKIASSQIAYSPGVRKGPYAVDLEALENAGLIDSVLGSGTKDGYAFSTSGDADTFTVNARPLTYGSTGTRSFFADESVSNLFSSDKVSRSRIRYTREDRPATVEDPPLEQ